jgi:hypothetical protein
MAIKLRVNRIINSHQQATEPLRFLRLHFIHLALRAAAHLISYLYRGAARTRFFRQAWTTTSFGADKTLRNQLPALRLNRLLQQFSDERILLSLTVAVQYRAHMRQVKDGQFCESPQRQLGDI